MKNLVLGLIVVALLAFAGWMTFNNMNKGGKTDDPGTVTEWICADPNCGEVYKWTAAQQEAMLRDPSKNKAGSGRQILYLCDKCGQYTVVRAQWCPEDKIWYPSKDLHGNRINCPEDERE